MADNNFIEIKIDTDSVVDSASKVAQALGQQGENAGNNLGQGIAKGLERSLSRIRMNFGRMQFFDPDATQIYFDEQGAERYRRSIMSMTDEYFRLQEVMRQTQEQRAEMQARLDLMAEGDENSDYFLGMSAGIEEADLAIEGLAEEMQALHRAITSTEDGQRYFDYANEQMANSANETAQAEGEQNRQLTRTNRTMAKTVSLSKLASGAFSKLKTIAGGVFKALHKDTNNTFGKGLANILKYALGIGTVAVAVNKLKGAVKEGFGHLYSYSSDVRKTMMSVTSSLGMFKNQIGASFEPILNVVAPILNQFISLLTQATVAFTNFIATLTGQSYIYKAVDDVKDLASGFGSASKGAKELKNATSKLDELNVIGDNSGGGGSTGTFKKVATEMSDFAKLIKDMIDAGDWEGVGGALADKIATALRNINWNKIRTKARKFGENLSAFIKGFFDPKYGLGEEIGIALAQSINTAFEFLDGLVSDRQMWKNIGVSFAQGIDGFVEGIDGDLIAQTINDLFLGAIDGARAFFEEGKARDTFHKFGEKVGEIIKEIKWEDILLGIGDVILEAIGACVAVIKGLNDSGAFDRIGEVINNVLSDKEFWTKAFTTVADAIFEALQAVTDIWNGAFDGHPIAKFIATGIATALIGSKVVGILGGGITSMLGAFGVTSAVSAGGTALGSTFATFFTSAIVAGVEGFELGKVIGKAFFKDDAEWYDNFRWTGEGGFFDAYVANFTEVGMRADISAYEEQLRVLGECYNNLTAEQIAFNDNLAKSSDFWTWDAESYADQINAVTLALEGYSEGMTLTEMGFASWTEYGDAMIEQLAEQGVTITGNTDLYNNFFGLMDAGVYKINENATSLEDLIVVSDEYAKSIDNTSIAVEDMNKTMSTISTTNWGEYYKNQATSLDDVSTSATDVSGKLPAVSTNLSNVSDAVNTMTKNNDLAVISIQGTQTEVESLAESLSEAKPTLEDFNTVWEDTFTNISDSTTETLSTMKDAMDEIFNGIITSVEVTCNSIITGVNSVIKALNGLSIDIPEMTDPATGKTYASQSISFAIPELSSVAIPRLARGAVIPANREFMAVLGDQHNGTNVEAPLDTIKQALIEALDDSSFISYLASISDYTRVTSEKDMSVRIGDRDIARANIRGQKQMGRTLITSV